MVRGSTIVFQNPLMTGDYSLHLIRSIFSIEFQLSFLIHAAIEDIFTAFLRPIRPFESKWPPMHKKGSRIKPKQ